MFEQDIDVSIVIACYNEMQVMEKNLARIEEILRSSRYSYEIILYDDGSTDGTRNLGSTLAKNNSRIIWKEHVKNMGRGRTVTDGLRIARGRISGFIDMDLEVPPEYILPLVLEIEKGSDVAIAWRMEHSNMEALSFYQRPYAIMYWILRFILSGGYSFLVKHLLDINLHDTEVGFKFFNHQRILPILDQIEDNHWFWDTELIARSYYAGLKIRELPALYMKNLAKKSTVKPIVDSVDYFKKLVRFRQKILPQLKSKSTNAKS